MSSASIIIVFLRPIIAHLSMILLSKGMRNQSPPKNLLGFSVTTFVSWNPMGNIRFLLLAMFGYASMRTLELVHAYANANIKGVVRYPDTPSPRTPILIPFHNLKENPNWKELHNEVLRQWA